MPSLTLREYFHRVRRSWSKINPISRSTATEKGDGAPPPYFATEPSSPQTSKIQTSKSLDPTPQKTTPSFNGGLSVVPSTLGSGTPLKRLDPALIVGDSESCSGTGYQSSTAQKVRNSLPGRKPAERSVFKSFHGPRESRTRLVDDLTLLTMEEKSTVEWTRSNTFRNADRFRHFLYHYLVWQYQVTDLHPMMTKQDQRHFILLCRLVSEWDYYVGCGFRKGTVKDEFLNRVQTFVAASLEEPVEAILHLDVQHVLLTMRAWVEEFGRRCPGPPICANKKFSDVKLETAARNGEWEEVAERVVRDLKMVDVVVPYGDEQARKSLTKAILRRQLYYLERAARVD